MKYNRQENVIRKLIIKLMIQKKKNMMMLKLKNCILKRLKHIKKLNAISQEVNKRKLEESHIRSLNHLKKIFKELKNNMEDHCDTIQQMHLERYTDSFRLSQSSNINEEQKQQQEEFIKPEDIIEQRDLVNQREQNIQEITSALAEIKDMSQAMFEVTKVGGQKLDKIIQEQDQHLDNIEKKLQVDLDVTEDYQTKMLKNCCFYSIIIVTLLMACVFIMFYFNKDNNIEQETPKKLMI